MKVPITEYHLALNSYRVLRRETLPSGLMLRLMDTADQDSLNDLAVDMHRGMVENATLPAHVNAYFHGEMGKPLLKSSWLCFTGRAMLSACLTAYSHESQFPFVVALLTRYHWQKRGIALVTLKQSLHSLAIQGYPDVYASINVVEGLALPVLQAAGFASTAHS